MKKTIWIMNHYASETYFDRGGRHYNFAKYLKQAGYEPIVFCSNTKHGAAERYLENDALWQEKVAEEIDVPYVFVRARTYEGNGKQRVLNMIDFYFNVKKAAKEYVTKYGKPDIIYASSVHPLTLVAGIQLAKKFGVKCICEVRDLWPESIVEYSDRLTKNNPVIRALYLAEKWIYKKADKLVFTTEGAYDYIVEQGWEKDIPREKVYYINNGVDLSAFRYNREHYQINDEDLTDSAIFKVVYVGSIRRVNSLGLLLDTAKEVKDPQVRFLIWGDGDELEQLKQRVADENIDNVVFKGRVEKKCIPYIVSMADLNVMHGESHPLFRFGISPNKLFDYLAAGKPILTDFWCKHNPAQMYGAGISVEKSSASLISAAIEEMMQLPEETRAQMGKNAETAAEEYNFERLTEKLVEIISQ